MWRPSSGPTPLRYWIASACAVAILFLGFALPIVAAAAEEPRGGWWSQARSGIERTEYEVSWQEGTRMADLRAAWQAPNRAHGFRTWFTENGIRLIPRAGGDPEWEWSLSLTGYGREGSILSVKPATLAVKGNRVDCDRGAIREWYVNEPRGLKHGLIVNGPRAADDVAVGPLVLELTLGGNLRGRPRADGALLEFATPAGRPLLRYSDLRVGDATGRELPARMELFTEDETRAILLVIDDAAAVYPLTVDPLTTSATWSAQEGQAGAAFGAAVTTAGDVNGDGYADVIVGAPGYDGGEADEGRALLFLGSAAGPAAVASWTAEGDQAGAAFGAAVATAGDVDGDGYSDLIVGAPGYDDGETDEGRVFVYHGSSVGLSAAADWTAESDQADSGFGGSVMTAGDVDSDGYSDVVVGAPEYDDGETDEGRVFVYHGSSGGLSATADWTAESDQVGAAFGTSVMTAGDVNGDGYADLIVGAGLYDGDFSDEGAAFVYHGSGSGLSAAADWSAEGDQAGSGFGTSVGTIGDVNGDGYADVVVGVDLFDGDLADEGAAFVYHGSASGLSATADWSAEGDQAGSGFGAAAGTAGDVNGDGYADLIVGAPLYDDGETDEGAVFAWFGSATGLGGAPDWVVDGDEAQARFGSAATTAGDVDGDGYSDVIAGAPGTNEAAVFSGYATRPSTTAEWTVEGSEPSDYLGRVSSAGDVNGDGFADIVVSSEGVSGLQVFHGSPSGISTVADWVLPSGVGARTAGDVNGDGYADLIVSGDVDGVFLGSPSGLASTPSWTYEDGTAATAGDVNGDGYSDVIVGRSTYANGQTDEGAAFLYLGSGAGLETTATWMAESNQESALFGSAVATAGDVNGDGYSDVMVAALRYDNGETDEGAVFVYHGSASDLSPSAAWMADGGQEGAKFGYSISTAGDINGDGYSDVIIGVPCYGLFEPYWCDGIAKVCYGSSEGLAGCTQISGQVESEFGTCVANAGDVNGDGYSDVIVGQPVFGLGNEKGSVHLFLGQGPSFRPWVEAEQTWTYFGRSIASAGDVNGDGYADVLVGEPYFDSATAVDAGRVYLYYGNDGRGLSLQPQQRRADDSAPVAPLGAVGSDGFRISLLGRPPYGRAGVRLEWEVKPLGTLFDGNGTEAGGVWVDSGTAGALLNETTAAFVEGGSYHWRARLLYDIVSSPFLAGSRWVTIPWNGWEEADLRVPLPEADDDSDGFTPAGGDCDDTDATVYPGAPQLCDGINNDCEEPGWPVVSPDETDDDSDGIAECAGDCDDTEAAVYPGAPQLCDGINNDCDDPLWPAVPPDETDEDSDGYSACAGDTCPSVFDSHEPGAALVDDLGWESREYSITSGGAFVVFEDGNPEVELYSVPVSGGDPVRLSIGGFEYIYGSGFRISPDGTTLVWMSVDDASGFAWLVSNSVQGGSSSTFSMFSWVGDPFRISPDGSLVVYEGLGTCRSSCLYAEPIGGGGYVQLAENTASFVIGPDGSRVVYRSDMETESVWELYSVPILGGEAEKLSGPLVAGGDVEPEAFAVSPDGSRVVYRADQDTDEVVELYSVPMLGGTPVKLNAPLVSGGDVKWFLISPDGNAVVYSADQETDEVWELYSVSMLGGPPVKLNAPLVPGGDVADVYSIPFAVSADGDMVVYRADQRTDEVWELYSVPITGGTPATLNGTLTPGGDVDRYSAGKGWAISPDGSRVVYRADQETDGIPELYSVPLTGGTPVKLNRPLLSDNVSSFAISTDGARVVYIASQDSPGYLELYSVPISGGPSIKLSGPLVEYGDVFNFRNAFDSDTIVYIADEEVNSRYDLYRAMVPSPDSDGDGQGDACDDCPLDRWNDADSDALCGDVDNCPFEPNPGQEDLDGDAVGDVCDNCPATVNANQWDADADTVGDACDGCPYDPGNDIDSDGLCGDVDNCPLEPNTGQEDLDSDAVGDVCDNCPATTNTDQADADADTVGDACDNCPATVNVDQTDTDADNVGDACDDCPYDPGNDIDSDGLCGDVDNCPAVANADQSDGDGDGAGDPCDCSTSSQFWAVPGEVRALEFIGPGTLTWTAPQDPGGTVVAYDTLRTDVLNDFTPPSRVCVEKNDGSDTTAEDLDEPASGGLFHYLVVAENECGTGPAGTDSGGLPRDVQACP